MNVLQILAMNLFLRIESSCSCHQTLDLWIEKWAFGCVSLTEPLPSEPSHSSNFFIMACTETPSWSIILPCEGECSLIRWLCRRGSFRQASSFWQGFSFGGSGPPLMMAILCHSSNQTIVLGRGLLTVCISMSSLATWSLIGLSVATAGLLAFICAVCLETQPVSEPSKMKHIAAHLKYYSAIGLQIHVSINHMRY